ncbi:MAG: PEP-CTERM sorting domain-containing protein [Gammaproteobacteria bacterium]|nr:MAG: PEP-CTERM sorting domain-containing protein [Gammaproteobacteria bacterium]
MNKKHFFRNFLSIVVVGFSLNAHAVIIDGTFKGTVFSVGDNGDFNNPYYENFFSDDLLGGSLSGSFWYDTDLAPANMGTTGQWRFTENTNWLGVTFNVDGKTLNPADIPAGFTQSDVWEMHNIADVNGYTGIHDFNQEYFGIRKDVAATNGSYSIYQLGGISFLDTIIPYVNGNSLIQDFTWHDDGKVYENWDDNPALALYFYSNDSPDNLIYASVAGRISEITAGPRNVEVPEPSAIILLGLGFMALSLRQRKFLK